MCLHLHEVRGRGGPLHGLPLPGVPRGVHDDEGGGEGGAPVVPGDNEEAVEGAHLQVLDLGTLSGGIQLLKLFKLIMWSPRLKLMVAEKYVGIKLK